MAREQRFAGGSCVDMGAQRGSSCRLRRPSAMHGEEDDEALDGLFPVGLDVKMGERGVDVGEQEQARERRPTDCRARR